MENELHPIIRIRWNEHLQFIVLVNYNSRYGYECIG